MVRNTPPPTTITVLKKKPPRPPLLHAREKLSHCSACGLSDSGSLMMYLSLLNDETTTHRIGYTTMIAQTIRNRWEKPPKSVSPSLAGSVAALGTGPRAPPLGAVRLSFTTTSAMSELDSLAPVDPQLD